jgi:hypothetical protein
MNSAAMDKSERLIRVMGVLRDLKRHTTRDIIRKARVCAVNSCISELRDNGIAIECERQGKVWRYWLQEGL